MLPGTNSFSQFVFEDHAAFHHEFHFLQFGNVLKRVAAHGHDVCPFAGFDRTSRSAPTEQLSSDRGSRSNRLHRGHAILDVVLKFFSLTEFFPVEATSVGAQSNLHSLLHGLGEVGLLQREGLLEKFGSVCIACREAVIGQ